MDEPPTTELRRALPIFDADNASASMGITLDALDADGAEFIQVTQPWFAGMDGHISRASLGPLLDAVLGAMAYIHTPERTFVVSALHAAFVGDYGDGDALIARPTSILTDAVSDTVVVTAQVSRSADDNQVVATASCRAVPIERPRTDVTTEHGVLAPNDAIGSAPIDPGVSGREQLDACIGGTSLPAPLPRTLRMTVTGIHESRVTGRWLPATWMTNPLGSVQGGIVFAVAAEAASLAATLVRAPHQQLSFGDVAVDLLASPQPDLDIAWTAMLVRSGRRLVSAEVTIGDPAHSSVYARARCTFFRVD
ncbi:hypothetical protein EF294_19045 [Gordonia oryzae]|uniref:PaaI family thioesterase n=2 Tax=Gordonia oryzae TaxID=2487349 RepID=A0A3N4G4P5_9ACTN|nr:hypothetical protein EF294_19045 [Gordonia oryzae]